MTPEQKKTLWAAIKAIPQNQRRTEIFTFGNMNWYADKLNSTVYVCSKFVADSRWQIQHILTI